MDVIPLPSKNPRVVRVRFNGIVYRRYPHCKGASNRKYFRCGHGDAKRGFGWLHRDIWAFHNGPIPDGWHVHHKDENTLNNAPDNLECLAPGAHFARHADDLRVRAAITWARSRPKLLGGAAAWHRSDKGRAWHGKQIRERWKYTDAVAKECEHCGAVYHVKPLGQPAKFCSPNCRAASRRKAGVDNCDRDCLRVGRGAR